MSTLLTPYLSVSLNGSVCLVFTIVVLSLELVVQIGVKISDTNWCQDYQTFKVVRRVKHQS